MEILLGCWPPLPTRKRKEQCGGENSSWSDGYHDGSWCEHRSWSWSNHGWHDNTWWDDSWQGHRPSWLYQQQPGSMRSYERVHRGYNRRRGGKHLHHYNQVLGQGRVCKMHPDVEILTSCPLAPERTWWRWTNLSSHVDEVELINGEIHAADTPNGLHVRFVRACDAQACVKGLTSSWLKSPKIWGTTHAGILNLIFGYFGARFFLHKPYPYSLYHIGEDSSILRTWNVWWLNNNCWTSRVSNSHRFLLQVEIPCWWQWKLHQAQGGLSEKHSGLREVLRGKKHQRHIALLE